MKNALAAMFMFLSLGTGTAMAEVLLIDAIASEPENVESGLLRPKNGMSMDRVRAKFGEPVTTYDAVGDPPITRWDYADFSVFFEHDITLTSVVHR